MIINSERLSEEERLEDEKLFESDKIENSFRVPIVIKDSSNNMILLFGGTHLEKMMSEQQSCEVWLITRERWRQ